MLKILLWQAFASVLFILSACSSLTDDEGIFRDRKFDYRKAEATDRMQIPDGLDEDAIYDLYVVPELSPYADQNYIYTLPMPTALLVGDPGVVTVQKLADEQWILVNDSASRLWPRLKQFLSQQKLLVAQEIGREGLIEVRGNDGFYAINLEQGFQRNTTEIYVRQYQQFNTIKNEGMKVSDSAELEEKMLMKLAEFLADPSTKSAYSFIARGVSAKAKLRELRDQAGSKTLLLEVSRQRALASVAKTLDSAHFRIQENSETAFTVQYYPPIPESQKPGFWQRLFGADSEGYDESLPYAGEFYRVFLIENTDGILLTVERVSETIVTDNQDRQERNTVIELIKGQLS